MAVLVSKPKLHCGMLEDMMLTKSRDCSKFEFERTLIEFMHSEISYTLGGLY